ncbi:hypothetical protein J3E72DRAFT_191621 [Bipolaris maydis]|uniref:uncharacterized protein n=1 Tax=Cochliobolus heterostrophus TaxID=5016 RepID=UPI0003234101|nr:hypothetical protein BM1_00803 [Bipolaris maydis]KAJ5026382.1 hypothetical protein J3E73DRAFT_256785 [Bipolaris maydis]KAJ5059898.1 hypothetical protein J3E74DRAFT_217614 [Bipolaris maydis]KAJ6197135.1 hypothetical protein J3E72DRAFT_191621 [Bipolaris maydis]KAJ6209895.1 hypothetical protein PSV09DRAFT_2258352 [Bipolaris maydis]
MQFTTTFAAAAIMALTASAASIPQPIPQVTLRIFNDQTGVSADTTVPADGTVVTIPARFTGSALDSGNGNILGTSAQLVQFEDTTKCKLANLNIPSWIIELDGRAKNFADLDGDVTKPVPTWLNGFQFSCVRA